jgi:hypothetical protein
MIKYIIYLIYYILFVIIYLLYIFLFLYVLINLCNYKIYIFFCIFTKCQTNTKIYFLYNTPQMLHKSLILLIFIHLFPKI